MAGGKHHGGGEMHSAESKKMSHKGHSGGHLKGHGANVKSGLIASPMAKVMEGKKGHAGK